MTNYFIINDTDIYGEIPTKNVSLNNNVTNNSIVLTNSPSNHSDNFTMELWAKAVTTAPADGQSNTGTSAISGRPFIINPTHAGNDGSRAGVGLALGTNFVGVYEHGNSYIPCVLAHSASLIGWNHYAIVYKNKLPHLYINGEFIKTGVLGAKATVRPSTNLGSGQYGTFKGEAKDFRVWDYPRTQEEIKRDMFVTFRESQPNMLVNTILSEDGLSYIETVTGNTKLLSEVGGVVITESFPTIDKIGQTPIVETHMDKYITDFNKTKSYILNELRDGNVQLVKVLNSPTDKYNLTLIKNNKSIVDLGSDLPSRHDVINMGMISPDDITTFVNPLDTLDSDFDIVTLLDEPQISKLTIDGDKKQSSTILYPTNDIFLLGVDTIESLTLNATGSGKVIVSVDSGTSWMTFRNDTWETITDLSEGIGFSGFANLTKDQINELITESLTVRFAYYITNDTVINDMTMKVTMKGIEQVSKNSKFDFSYDVERKTLVFTIKNTGQYSINYTDSD